MQTNIVAQSLLVTIVTLVDDHFPGWVACEFTDASERVHTIVEKLPVVSAKPLALDAPLPVPGEVRCEALARWHDAAGRELVRITIERPDHVVSDDGSSEFVVIASQLTAR